MNTNDYFTGKRFLVVGNEARDEGRVAYLETLGGCSWRAFIAVIGIVCSLDALAADQDWGAGERGNFFTRLTGEYRHQLSSDLEGGGEFDVDRFVSQASFIYRPDPQKSLSLSLGYTRDAYDFSASSGAGGLDPWGDIDTIGLAMPVIWGLSEEWTFLGIPIIRGTAEGGADWGEAVTGGGIAGVSYRVSDALSIGPGIGLLSQLEDSVSFFPVLVVDWKFANRWTLATGRGLGASQGPGLLLSYSATSRWSWLAGGRFERFRFRLRRDGVVPNGVGEDRGVPLYVGARYGFGNGGTVTCFAGVDVAGEIRVDSASGTTLISNDYDPAPFFGVTASFSF